MPYLPAPPFIGRCIACHIPHETKKLRTKNDREGFCFTYDMWRNAILSNSGVKMLKGLQFGMLDEDNDGEVSLGDITRAVFRRANDRDLPRIRRFLEVNFRRAICHGVRQISPSSWLY